MPVTLMSPNAIGWENHHTGESWRFNVHTSRRNKERDPNFCFLDAHVEINGKLYCNKHAGQICLEMMLGERDPSSNGQD